MLKQGKPRSRAIEVIETSGNSGVIYYMTAFRPFFNPATGEWIEYTAVAEDNNGGLVRFTWRSVPGGVISEHIHPNQEEQFTIVSGEATFTVNAEQHVATAGADYRCAPWRPALRRQSRHRRDHRRGRTPAGVAHQGVPRGAGRPGGRREDQPPGGRLGTPCSSVPPSGTSVTRAG